MVTAAILLLLIGAYLIGWVEHRSVGSVDGDMWLVAPFMFGIFCVVVGAILLLISAVRYAI